MARMSNAEIAAERGITVEQLQAEREANKAKRLPAIVKCAATAYVRSLDASATLDAEEEQALKDVHAKFAEKRAALGGQMDVARASLVTFAASMGVTEKALDTFVAEYQTQRLDRKGDGSGATE